MGQNRRSLFGVGGSFERLVGGGVGIGGGGGYEELGVEE
jgi:hypothetical protein